MLVPAGAERTQAAEAAVTAAADIAGADAIAMAEQVIATLRQEADAFRELSKSLALDVEPVNVGLINF